MNTAIVILTAYAVGWALIGFIQERGHERTNARRGGLQPQGRAIMMTALENTRCEATGETPPARLATRIWHTGLQTVERETRSQVATGWPAPGPTNVPRPRDRVNERTSRIGVGRRAGVGTHRVSRVPVRMAQPARRRGGSHREHPTRNGPFRDLRGVEAVWWRAADTSRPCPGVTPGAASSDSRTADRR